jgi:hypothetical protein
MLRGEGLEISRNENNNGGMSTANIASLVHIDTDVGGYESINELLHAIDKNKVEYTSMAMTNDVNDVKDMATAINNEKKRFAIINFWRNINDEPVSSSPLAILSTRYNNDEHERSRWSGLPNTRPNMNNSRYYIFPQATKDEVIVFYQYDRNARQTSDMWHCAIKQQQQQNGGGKEASIRPRRSFDIRALVVFDETVPDELDRFHSDRIRPKLTMEESECFCEKQGEDRRSKMK